MSKEDKEKMMAQYKIKHKEMYTSVKQRLKAQHLERLQKLAQLRKEQEDRKKAAGTPGEIVPAKEQQSTVLTNLALE